MSTLSTTELNKSYKGRKIVNSISLSVQSGQIVGLLGPNGAGKTTTFYMIAGSIRPDSGHILLNDKTITRLPMHKRARQGLSYLPQESSIFRKMNVADNILAILELRPYLNKKQRKTRLNELLEEFHISHLRNASALSLSGGERRRVEIARALATDPKFMLLDEPFAGIDPISIGDIKSIIQTLKKQNIGILITDHNVRETLDICEHAYIVHEGQVIAEGNTHQVLSNPTVKSVYLGDTFSL